MSDYVPLNWTDEVPDTSPVKYIIKDGSGVTIHPEVTIDPVTSIIPGTPLNAVNLNHIEQGIDDAESRVAALEASLGGLVKAYNRFNHSIYNDAPITVLSGLQHVYLSGFTSLPNPTLIKKAFIYVKSKWAVASEDNYLIISPTSSPVGMYNSLVRLYSLAANIPNTICLPIEFTDDYKAFAIRAYGADTLSTTITVVGYVL